MVHPSPLDVFCDTAGTSFFKGVCFTTILEIGATSFFKGVCLTVILAMGATSFRKVCFTRADEHRPTSLHTTLAGYP